MWLTIHLTFKSMSTYTQRSPEWTEPEGHKLRMNWRQWPASVPHPGWTCLNCGFTAPLVTLMEKQKGLPVKQEKLKGLKVDLRCWRHKEQATTTFTTCEKDLRQIISELLLDQLVPSMTVLLSVGSPGGTWSLFSCTWVRQDVLVVD